MRVASQIFGKSFPPLCRIEAWWLIPAVPFTARQQERSREGEEGQWSAREVFVSLVTFVGVKRPMLET